MKILLIYLSLIIIILTGCKKDDTFTQSEYAYVIKGNCSYTEALTGNAITTNTNISIKIKYKNSSEVLPEGLKTNTNGNTYEFGPLKAEVYIITAEYLDNATMIFYRTEQEVTITGHSLVNDLVLTGSPNTIFIKGSIAYTNTITGLPAPITTGLTGTITSVNDNIQLPNNGIASFNGNNYSFGPLLSKSYELKFSYTDSYGLKYSVTNILDLNTLTGPIVFQNYQLSWEASTTLVATITDSLNNPIQGAQVYLYNNYHFLQLYKDNVSTAIAYAISNASGKVVFTNLTAVPHFMYAKKIMANDTLTNYNPAFIPGSQPALNNNQINTIPEIVK